jgi:hypothetical protein
VVVTPKGRAFSLDNPRIFSWHLTHMSLVHISDSYTKGKQGSVGRQKGTNKLYGPCFKIAYNLSSSFAFSVEAAF